MTPLTRRVVLVTSLILAHAILVAAVGTTAWWTRRAIQTPAGPALEQLGDYGAVPEFAFTERSGRRVTRTDLRGLVWIADFIYTQCQETCPTQSLAFAQLQREFAGTADVGLVSITVDPAHDTPVVLRRYAERYGAGDRWWFLTGTKHEIYCLAHEGFRLSVVDPADVSPPACGRSLSFGPAPSWASHGSTGLVMHSARAVLVDRAGGIRAYHVATESASMTRLRANLRALLAERGNTR
jgi:cytochrome oxidase Cu insertion factor (SCO1/SenC/PrrC family)